MTKADKISKINDLASVEGFISLEPSVNIKDTDCNLITDGELVADICGDWCYVSRLEDLTDEEIDIVFNAVQRHALGILSQRKYEEW